MSVDLEQLGLAVKRLQHRHHRALETRLAQIGSTLAQWDALRAIERQPDSSTHRLAQLTFQSDQSFGALANRMLSRGLIERLTGPGRAVRHRLTPDGEEMLRAGYVVVGELLDQAFAPLGPAERDTLHALLLRLLDGPDLLAADRP
ncbi:MarR family winged helix-turn-helix transcriptional regulator [Kitasatospora sp. NBC_00315]|uniref:MarR family winged helix-turn-helix transcriptional regulator n=1 Tax=Kitasatospora sp. NBC_00315 TaxID=2975963 RepID=UPI003248C82F